MKKFLLLLILASSFSFSQQDSVQKKFSENPFSVDSLKLKVKDIIISGNEVTKDEIILREMNLKPGKYFTIEKYSKDLQNIYNLGLFNKVDIYPIPVESKQIMLNIDVNERWYILPLPSGGIEDGEFKKVWAGINLRWDNFRGRNESVNLGFRLFYNPSVSLSYYVPWIGEKLHLFTNVGGSWSRSRNKSLTAVGKENGSGTITFSDENYENTSYSANLQLGKYFFKQLGIYTRVRYNYLSVNEYKTGRTVSSTGIDKYYSLGGGFTFDNRDIKEYATKGFQFDISANRYSYFNSKVDFYKFRLESQSFLPLNFNKDYYITIASRIVTALASGESIPFYHRELLGYSDEYVRGWKSVAFEGDNILTAYNEIRIPVISPRYIDAKNILLVRDMPILKKMSLRHGLYFTLTYDVGTAWDKSESIAKQRFLSGAGIGINFIAPFGYVLRLDWTARLNKPVIGQINFSTRAKF